MRLVSLIHCHTSVNTSKASFLTSLSTQIVRQILATAQFGDTVQVGLYLVAPVAVSPEAGDSPVFEIPLDATEPADSTSQPDPNLPLRCTFQITHTFAQHNAGVSQTPGTSARTKPSVESPILHRLVHHTKASFTHELTDTAFTCKLSLTLERGSSAIVNPVVLSDNDPIFQAFPDFKLSGEPTLEDLSKFVGTLKGKKVSLYANSTGIFAQHLTSYLSSWGLDVNYISSDLDAERSPVREAATPPFVEYPLTPGESFSGGPILQTLPEQDTPQPTPLTAKAQNQSPAFILIDDDISVLRERLRKLRAELLQPFQLSRKRPTLAAHHRPRSSPQVPRAIGHSTPTLLPRNAPVILHFTSLANFKLVKAILQTVLGPGSGTSSRLPEVLVIPKPAGPRRVLTALHTAATKPIVDPFFSPIATSPMSPGLNPAASYFPQNASPKSPMTRPSSSPRGFSHQSLRSPRAAFELPDGFGLPPSPLGLSEGMDYFSEAAEKLGSSPSSGLVIQSPNGQPAGIFFHPPRSRNSRPSSQSVSAEHVPVYSRGSRRHSDTAERTRQAGGVTFLNLPGPIPQRHATPPQVPLDPARPVCLPP
jgi:osomolarity two-component system response regulator SSK1